MAALAGVLGATLAGSAVDAAGNALSASAAEGPFVNNPLRQRTGGFFPEADPLNAAVSFDALLRLGYGDLNTSRQILMMSSPIEIEKARIMKHPYMTEREKRITIASGFSAELRQRNAEYIAQVDAKLKQVSQFADPFVSRLQATQRAGELVGGTGQDTLLEQNRRMLENRRADQFGRSRERILQEANAGGFNPAGVLGDLERENFLLSDANSLNATNLTNQQVGGELQNILAYLGYGSAQGQNASQQRLGAATNAAAIGLQNASAADAARVGPGASPVGAGLSTAGQGIGAAAALAGSHFLDI